MLKTCVAQVEERIEEVKRHPDMQLTEGWTTSPHYAQGYIAGQFALLIELKKALTE
jgi:hypothetical protein